MTAVTMMMVMMIMVVLNLRAGVTRESIMMPR